MLRFHALGGLTVSDDDEEVSIGGPRQRRLVAMLLIHRNAVVSVDRLAEAVFAGAPTPAASTTLRSYVARIRRVVDGNGSAAAVVTQAPGYMLRLSEDAFDVARFERLVADAGSRLGRGDAAGASSVLREAMALWGGEAYAEFADEEWVRAEAQRLAELRLVAQERLVEAELACGRVAAIIPEIESLVGEHELRDAFRAQLMMALYRTGRQADALRVLRDYRQVFRDELGLEPSPALVELERRVLNHDPTLLLPEPAGLPLRGYRLGERLGTGRDGTVYAARLQDVERDFAIRVIREEIADRPDFVRSFEAAAHRLASLRHPAIVPIHDYWREPGAAYVVMRRMSGGTLSDRLDRGPLTNAATATVVSRIGGALATAAEQGIGHGRVIPESVLYDGSGEPYLADFALTPSNPDPRCGDDTREFAELVDRCLAGARGPVGEILALGRATVGRPAMTDFVAMLVAALAGTDAVVEDEPANPYKGLRAFDEADAADFFGRDELVEEILARLACEGQRARLVMVVGGSGTGKSSLVRAGLLPRLRHGHAPGSQDWFIITMLPGSSPFKELAESLRHVAVDDTSGLAEQLAERDGGIDSVIRRLLPGGGQLLLVVDQLEELFTLATEGDQRAFLDGLIHAVQAPDSRLRVVATLRADFYDRPLAFQRFGAAVNGATVTISAMSPAELEAAVVEPAERVGRQVDRALVAELVNAVVDEPAALPSLQFALYELAERSPDQKLTMAAYRELGGVEGAISSRAELLYRSLDDAERSSVRQMFERLVVVGAEGEPTRRRVARAEVSGVLTEGSADTIIDRWAQARLLTLDRHPQTRVPTVELAHEALLREWPRLRRWIEEDREAIVVLGHVREAAASWNELGRDPGALYRGARLQVAVDVAGGRVGELPAAEQEFLDASSHERDREQQAETERIARQARANRRLRVQLAGIAVALVVALVGGFIALDQRRDAQHERRVATARELAAESEASLADDPDRSILLALAAVDETRSKDGTALPEAEAALHRSVSASRLLLNVPGVGGYVDWSPDGDLFVTEGPENSGTIDIRDAQTGASLRTFHGHDVDINDVAFSDDGSMLATTGDDGAARVWDPATGELLLEFQIDEPGPVIGPSFSPDGSRVAASFPDDKVRVFDLATGETASEIDAFWGETTFSSDGNRIAVGYIFDDGEIPVFDTATGEELLRLPGSDDGTGDVKWSPDGRWLATAGFDAVVRVWDADTGEQRFAMTGHTAAVVGLDWSPDSTRLASGSNDGTAKVSEIADGGVRELLSFSAQDTSGGLGGVAFSPDGERLMTGDAAISAVKIWDASSNGGGELANVSSAEFFGLPYAAVDFTPDGGHLLVGQADGLVSISDVESGDQLDTIEPRASASGDVGWVDVSSDGQLLATTSSEGPVDVRDAATGAHRFAVEVDGEVFGIEWSRDGELLAIVVNDYEQGKVVIVDRTGAEVATLREDTGQIVESASFSPDGRLLATARSGVGRLDPAAMKATVWDWKRGEVVSTIDTTTDLVVFDPTGTRIATSRLVEGVADVWDARTGDRVATLAASSEISDLTFGPDGTTLATGHADGTVRLWDPESGTQRLVLRGHEPRVVHVAFGPDGSNLASVDEDGLVRVWELDLDDLIAIAKDRLTRTLTDAECRQYLHVDSCPTA